MERAAGRLLPPAPRPRPQPHQVRDAGRPGPQGDASSRRDRRRAARSGSDDRRPSTRPRRARRSSTRPAGRSPGGATTPPRTRTSPRHVGITTGAIYHYFASKADLYVAVYEEVQVAHLRRLREGDRRRTTTFPDRLAAALDAAVEINLRDSSIAGVRGRRARRAGPPRAPPASASPSCRVAAARSSAAWSTTPSSEASWPPTSTAEAVNDMVTAVTSGLARFSTQVEHRAATARRPARSSGCSTARSMVSRRREPPGTRAAP